MSLCLSVNQLILALIFSLFAVAYLRINSKSSLFFIIICSKIVDGRTGSSRTPTSPCPSRSCMRSQHLHILPESFSDDRTATLTPSTALYRRVELAAGTWYLIYIILYYIINITFLKMSPFLNSSLGDVIINKQTPHVRFFPESHD